MRERERVMAHHKVTQQLTIRDCKRERERERERARCANVKTTQQLLSKREREGERESKRQELNGDGNSELIYVPAAILPLIGTTEEEI